MDGPFSHEISVLQFTTYSTATVILFVAFFVVLISVIFIIAFRMIARQKLLEQRAIEHRFRDNCKRYHFDDREIELIKLASSRFLGDNPNDIFEIQNVYEHAVHEDIESAIDRGGDFTEIENAYGSIRKKLHYILLPEGIPLVSTRSISSGNTVSLVDIKCEALLVQNLETHFVLKYPPDKTVLINPDAVLRIAFSRSNDGLYAVDVRVLEHSGARIKCRHSINLRRNQLRKDVRMRLNAKMKLFIRDSENNRINIDGRLVDISAGGFCFESSIIISVKTDICIISCSLPVQLSGFRATIIASSERMKDEEEVYKYHAAFIGIPFEKKEKIVTYLFAKMREQQKK